MEFTTNERKVLHDVWNTVMADFEEHEETGKVFRAVSESIPEVWADYTNDLDMMVWVSKDRGFEIPEARWTEIAKHLNGMKPTKLQRFVIALCIDVFNA